MLGPRRVFSCTARTGQLEEQAPVLARLEGELAGNLHQNIERRTAVLDCGNAAEVSEQRASRPRPGRAIRGHLATSMKLLSHLALSMIWVGFVSYLTAKD